MTDAYQAFLEAKAPVAVSRGLALDISAINPILKPHQAAIVRWMVEGGRRACFAAFGLGKTIMQLEAMRLILEREEGRGLIVLPLGVRQEFAEDAAKLGMKVRFIRRIEEVDDDCRLYLTNYETIRDGKIDPAHFVAASLDEASALRGFGGTKTFREFMAHFAGDDRKAGTKSAGLKYRFVATATPSPNQYIELLAYAAFLGIMDVGEAKTRFFKRNSEHADQLTIHPHKEREFWLWIASWAVFIQKPSDLGFDDTGYDMPPLDVRWHEVPTDHTTGAGFERDGQARLLRNSAIGITNAAREKRDSLGSRIARMEAIRAEEPDEHRIIWHDLEAERRAIEAAIPSAVTVYGSMSDDDREAAIIGFRNGEVAEMAGKPVMIGSGCNFQKHCARAIFLGIGFKFNDFIQAIYRIQRFGQLRDVRIDIIYTEAEREVRRALEDKWTRHNEAAAIMGDIIREYGLSSGALVGAMTRSIGCERQEVRGDNYRVILNDTVVECRDMPSDSMDLIVTSIPFGTQYEYSPSYNDFGHTDDDVHFWRQMDFLTPNLLRVLRPGRVAAIHVKDRIVPGGINGLGFQTVSPFSDDCVAHFRKHGFAFLARRTIVTDVVRENNQTYRLGWTEQLKDGSRMGAGMPEYVLLFRKPPTDLSNGYADDPVVKARPDYVTNDGDSVAYDGRRRDIKPVQGTGYSRGRWQLDAHGFWRSSGDRLLTADDLKGLDASTIYKVWRERSLTEPYDHEGHVAVCEGLDARGSLPPDFMLLPPASWHPDVWTDVTRMLTLNGQQYAKGQEAHLCPLQFDIVDRLIRQHSMPGETVFDPFGGLMTVPYRALRLGRKGVGVELDIKAFRDGAAYCEAMARELSTPSLFDLLETREAA
jgi:DNA modification methylase